MDSYGWKSLDLDAQDHYVRFWYPSMERLPSAPDEAVWRGRLRAKPESPLYTVCVWYRLGQVPRVWVREVMLAKHKRSVPHIYEWDYSLCLYWPSDRRWQATDVIAYTILPWTCSWLGFYELWVDTDHWYGPEAPHTAKPDWRRILSKPAKERK
jgi:hypothetical protein